jgi:hypothetical protein
MQQPRTPPRRHGAAYARPHEDFAADFSIIARRTLLPVEWNILNLHLIGGRQWREVAPMVGLDRGQFFHAVYRVQHKLGKAFRETRPYGLWPLSDYFRRVR